MASVAGARRPHAGHRVRVTLVLLILVDSKYK